MHGQNHIKFDLQ